MQDIPLSRDGAFLRFWFARVFGTLASQMQSVAIGWQIYGLTRNPLDLGLVGLAQFLPSVLLMFVSGHVIDRYDRRAIVMICLIMESLASILLVSGSLWGWLDKNAILAIVFWSGAARAFKMPATQALLPNVVPAALYPRALAASASAMQVAIIAGPALGGFVYLASPVAVYSAACLCFTLAAFLASGIRTRKSGE
ncbi:MAG TPA: MFS transporter, partial [Burkholderiales bacterium]|nr:MFS transporter [Burkholderiales bacterium]